MASVSASPRRLPTYLSLAIVAQSSRPRKAADGSAIRLKRRSPRAVFGKPANIPKVSAVAPCSPRNGSASELSHSSPLPPLTHGGFRRPQ